MTTARITNLTRGTVLASRALVPETPSERTTGLLNHEQLLPGEGLLLLNCSSIHTFGMKFSIDVCFLDLAFRVLWCRRVNPRERVIHDAKHIIELPAGALKETRFYDQFKIDFI